MYLGLNVNSMTFLPKFAFERFSKKSPIPNFMEICTVGATLIHSDTCMDRGTDGHVEVNRCFSQQH